METPSTSSGVRTCFLPPESTPLSKRLCSCAATFVARMTSSYLDLRTSGGQDVDGDGVVAQADGQRRDVVDAAAQRDPRSERADDGLGDLAADGGDLRGDGPLRARGQLRPQ